VDRSLNPARDQEKIYAGPKIINPRPSFGSVWTLRAPGNDEKTRQTPQAEACHAHRAPPARLPPPSGEGTLNHHRDMKCKKEKSLNTVWVAVKVKRGYVCAARIFQSLRTAEQTKKRWLRRLNPDYDEAAVIKSRFLPNPVGR
jgi:hypothetical protein